MDRKQDRRRLRMSIILLLLALMSMIAASVAWFTLTDHGRVDTIDMEITSGTSMKFDLDAHGSIDQYVDTLTFAAIAGRIESEQGFDLRETPLMPVTTEDAKVFTYETGESSSDDKGDYLTFKLHFMAEEDMVVHLTADDGDDKAGTVISSDREGLKEAMRISFTDGEDVYIYDPGMGDTCTTSGKVKTYGLVEGVTEFNNNNSMFSLTGGEDKEILVHIWLEGTDEECTDDLKGSDYKIAMKFRGADEEHNAKDQDMKRTYSDDESTDSNLTDEDEDSMWHRIVKAVKEITGKYK